jgi:hypothetical protein
MPLQSGNWVANINGNVTPLQIIGVDSRGVVVSSISGTRFSGFWDEDAQKLTLNLPVVQGTSAEVYRLPFHGPNQPHRGRRERHLHLGGISRVFYGGLTFRRCHGQALRFRLVCPDRRGLSSY